MRYEVKLSGDAEHKTVKPPEWLSSLHDKLARIVAKILYARETSKPEKQDLDATSRRRDPARHSLENKRPPVCGCGPVPCNLVDADVKAQISVTRGPAAYDG